MVTYKNIRIKKAGGGTRMQRVQVLRSGKYKFVKNKGSARASSTKSRRRVTRKRAAPVRRRRTSMVRRRKKGGRRKQKIPIAATAGMIFGLLELKKAYTSGGSHAAMVALTGYDPNFGWNYKWARATIPMVLGAGVSMVAAKSGINRYVKVPFVKI